MSARVLVMRHGERARGGGDAGLSPRGVQGARAAAAWMAERGLRPDLVVTTDRARTIETASVVVAALGAGPPRVERVRSFPNQATGWARFTATLPLPSLRCALLVVHRPTQHLVERSFGGERFGVSREHRAAVFVLTVDAALGWRVEDVFPGLAP